MSSNALFDDMMAAVVDVLGTTIKLYKPNTTPNADASTMTRVPSYDTITIQGSDRPVIKNPIDNGGRTAQVATHTYDIRLADCASLGIPDESWLLGIGSDATAETALKIVRAEADAQGQGMVLTARKGG